MSVSLEDGPLKEAAIFTRAVENVFRKLIRLLLGRMTLVRLQEMIRLIFVEEAELHLKRERPGKNVPLTKMALMTGLDTRTLNKIQVEIAENLPIHLEGKFLREITPECSVLDSWASNSIYLDSKSKNPIPLKLCGDEPSFESLVKNTLSSRGITPQSLLEKLIESESVSMDENAQTVTLLDRQFLPFKMEGTMAAVDLGLAAVGNLIETVGHNTGLNARTGEAFFQRSNWTHRLSLRDIRKFRAEIRQVLKRAEQKSVDVLAKYEENETKSNQFTAGVGIFYFEEEAISNIHI